MASSGHMARRCTPKRTRQQIDHALKLIGDGQHRENVAAILNVDRTALYRALAGLGRASPLRPRYSFRGGSAMNEGFNIHAARRLENIKIATLLEASAVQRETDLNALLRAAAARGGAMSGGRLKQEVEVILVATETMVDTVIAYRKTLAARVPDLLLADPYLKEFHTRLDQLADGAVIAVQQRHATKATAAQFPAATLNAVLALAARRASVLKNKINNEIRAMALEGELGMHRRDDSSPSIKNGERSRDNRRDNEGDMAPTMEAARPVPRAFLSYAWESEAHREWVKAFATQLRRDGVNVTLDQWEIQPGDQLPAFMERAVRENDYVIIVCTPAYAERSNNRLGGVGYEGDIMTAETMTNHNQRKFIPVYRAGNNWEEASPAWLRGKYYVDLRGNPYSDERYEDLLTTLHGLRPTAPPIGQRPAILAGATGERGTVAQREEPTTEPIRIIGVVVDEVTTPSNDGTRGSALYRIPFQLSRRPTHEWAERFISHWNHPPQRTTMHRPGIASLSGDKIYLDGTTMEEVEQYHRDTLKLAIQETNRETAEHEAQQRAAATRAREQREEHERAVREAAQRLRFD
jgi:hypothetical protein